MRKGNTTMIASVLAIGLVMMGVGMGTMAYFSDTEWSRGNTFAAGTIDIAVGSGGVLKNPWFESFEMAFAMEIAQPCEVKYINFVIKNVGDNDLKVWKRLYFIINYGGVNVYPVGATVASSESEYEEGLVGEAYTEQCNLDEWITYDLKVDGNVLISPETEVIISDVYEHYIYLGVLAPGVSMTVEQSYHLKPDVTNWAQGDVMVFDIEIFAQQTAGSPPPLPPVPVYTP